MKSLEIVNEKLSNGEDIIRKKNNYYLMTNEQLETIKQDLEVLEMIKKGIAAYQDKFTTALEVICAMFDFNEEEYNKVKQWLEENERC
jgi:hypothetical protein